MLWSSKTAPWKTNKTNQAIQTHVRLEVQQLEVPFFYNSSVTTADLIHKSQNTQRHPYNSAAFRLCKCTDLASCIFPLLIATGNQHSCFLTAVHTLHREQAPVAECGSISEQATGSLNTSKHIPSKKTPFRVHVQYFLILPNSICGWMTKVSAPTDARFLQAWRFVAWKLHLIL